MSQQNCVKNEKGATVISFGCTKFYHYVFGRYITVEREYLVGHAAISNDKTLIDKKPLSFREESTTFIA